MKNILLLLSLLVLMTQFTWGQTTGDYRSAATGNWNTLATWERYNGTAWILPTSGQGTPTSTSGVITILNGHTVTVTVNVSIDQATVDAGGQITINSGITLTIANGTSTDLTVNGIVVNSGTITTTGTVSFGSGSTYQHTHTSGVVPTATWDIASTCLVTGMTGTLPTGIAGQTFGNLTWNCPNQSNTSTAIAGVLTVAGNLTILNTGTYQFRVQTSPITVGGDVYITGGTMWVAGQATKVMNVGGSVYINGGILDLMGYASTSYSGTLNIKGNLSCTSGTLQVGGTSTNSGIVFNGTGIQTFTSGGTINGMVNFTVNSGSTLQMADASTVVSGSGTFTLANGAALGITSPDGITSTGATGNIQVTGTRTFNTGSHYIYNGSSVQVTGNGLPATVNKLTINNTSGGPVGVTPSQALIVTDTLTLAAGVLDNAIVPVTLGPSGIVIYAGGSANGPLPVELTSFTAILQGTSALLNWTTATETNNSGFQIERSIEGSGVWAEVAFVNGAGTSNSPKTYSYEDKNLTPGTYIYRIKQIDNDGTITIYNPNALPKVDAGVVGKELQLCRNYPNPFNPSTTIQFSVPQDGYASLKVYNMVGQEVAMLYSGVAKAGHYIHATFNASRYASGIYFARLQFNGQSLVQRMLMTK
jgi:hypothetical protein